MATGTVGLYQNEILLADTVTVGTALTVAGVTIDENTLAVTDMTASATELNYLDITTLGTGAASKAVVLNSSGDYTYPATATIVYPSSATLTLQSGSTLNVAGTFQIGAVGMTATAAELNVLAGVTAGTTAASKGVVLDAAESLAWATTDATASETCTLTITDTRTGAGATGWAGKFGLESNVALGSYANGGYGIITFGASGKVTGLAAGLVSETVLSAGCVDGTYAGLEVELGMPANAVCGTETSLLYLSVYGADASTFDTDGFFFSLAGVTKASGKVLQDTTSGATIRPVQVLKVKTPDGTRYLPLYSTAAIAA